MEIIRGDIFEEHCFALCIPTNGEIRSDGKAVMGKGLALQAVLRSPGLDRILASKLRKFGNVPHILGSYVQGQFVRDFISFPTKHHWREKSDLELIKRSATLLLDLWKKNPHYSKILIPEVGCGLGELSPEIVFPVVNSILGNEGVFYWIRYEKSSKGKAEASKEVLACH